MAHIHNQRLEITMIWNASLQKLTLVTLLQALLMQWKLATLYIFFFVIGPCIGAKKHLKMNGGTLGMRGI